MSCISARELATHFSGSRGRSRVQPAAPARESFDAINARVKAECDRDALGEGKASPLVTADRLRLLSGDWLDTASAHFKAIRESQSDERREAHEIGYRVCLRLAEDYAKRYRVAVRGGQQ